MTKTDSQRLDDLEILAAHQARLLDELNDVVTAQSETIGDLRRNLDVLARRLAEAEARSREPTPVDRPPHW